jgi:hypothetical protein
MEVSAGKVAESAMNDPQAVCRGGGPEVVLVDDGYGKSPEGRVPRGAGSKDTGANDKEIELSVGKPWDVASHGGQGGVESSGS